MKKKTRWAIGRICRSIATLSSIGYLPAPGTFGTLAAIIFLGFARFLSYRIGISPLAITLLVMVAAFWLIKGALIAFPGDNDPQEIVLDEVAGFFVAMYVFPFKPVYIISAFLIFRFLDIAKPLGIDLLQGLPGAWGVMADDIAAGVGTIFFVSWIVYALQLFGIGGGLL
ncbi:MAG: phosphatidylglycerophosphatase A [Candidatus Dependentiae bacterium]|nr:phosphatidylglycerophosphatase A [Candidatus Dependentiae bacterium]